MLIVQLKNQIGKPHNTLFARTNSPKASGRSVQTVHTCNKGAAQWSYPDPNFFTDFELEFVKETKDTTLEDIPF
jgi:hypothetical protein